MHERLMSRHLNRANYVLRPFNQFISACVLQSHNCVKLIHLPRSLCNEQKELTYSLVSFQVPVKAECAKILVTEIIFMQVNVTRNFKCLVK